LFLFYYSLFCRDYICEEGKGTCILGVIKGAFVSTLKKKRF